MQDRSSDYNSMQVTLIKRYSNDFTFSSNYTLSKVEGNFGDELIPYLTSAGSGSACGVRSRRITGTASPPRGCGTCRGRTWKA